MRCFRDATPPVYILRTANLNVRETGRALRLVHITASNICSRLLKLRRKMYYALFVFLSVSTFLAVYPSLLDKINHSIETYGNNMLDEMKKQFSDEELKNSGTMYSPKEIALLNMSKFLNDNIFGCHQFVGM